MMEWKDVASAILNVAPALATALNAPAGMIVGGAVQILTKFLGIPDTATPEAVAEAAAKLGPDQYVELKRIDAEYNKQLLDVGVKLEEVAAADRDSARRSQAATGSKTPDVLAGLLTVFFFATIATLAFVAVPEGNNDILYSMVGMLGTVWIGFMTYFSGSTAQGARKTELLAKAPAVQ